MYLRWYIGDTWCTRTICCVLQPYVLYRSYTSLYVRHTSGTGRILRVPNLVHTLDHISAMIRRVYLVYTAIRCIRQPYVLYRSYTSLYVSHTSCTGCILHWTLAIRPVQDVWLTYKAYSPCTPSIPYVWSVIYGLMYAPNLVHEVYDLCLTSG